MKTFSEALYHRIARLSTPELLATKALYACKMDRAWYKMNVYAGEIHLDTNFLKGANCAMDAGPYPSTKIK